MPIQEQSKLMLKKEWKNLIVLDACRYDYFSEICDIKGKSKKVYSPAIKGDSAPTTNWYKQIFERNLKDCVHISAHPRVNSKTEVDGYNASKWFGKIYDLWDSHWDEEYGTVFPEDVSDEAKKIVRERAEQKYIIHFMQPHTPYICLPPPKTKKKKQPKSRNSIFRKIRNLAVKHTRNYIGDMQAVKLMEIFNMPPLSPQDDALRKVGKEGVKEAYEGNLKRALQSIKPLLDHLDGKTIITADHGELLGEKGRFGHSFKKEIKELVEVPWLEIE
ncbi:MAG: Arylsulfatase A family enzyme [Candidatus Methanohalarchaeum thermophilum]|uniref:Arylsulfatase A family enzyme n=1 Tax=Methanohalarchaeum thermophilum TaxID=1903181 RepID=A0A1Q6DST0_METT1|nr:MAG: Arylsulfatase A family enzyme [Candidatus Methanohalarchaeum thermophilum]